MTETKDQTHIGADPRLAPLSRADLPSFLLRIEDGVIAHATTASIALGLAEGEQAPNQILDLARSLVANRRAPLALVRLQLPEAADSHLFHCTLITMPEGPAMLFADSQSTGTAPLESAAPVQNEAPLPQIPAENVKTTDDSVQDNPPVRFTFAADAQNRLSGLSSTLMRALGKDAMHWQGATFAELEAAGRIVSAQDITKALAGQGSFIGVRVTTHGPLVLDLELGGVPLFDIARRRVATRGFGILRTWAETSTSSWIRSLEPAKSRPSSSGMESAAAIEPFDGALSPSESETFRDIGRTLHAVMSQGADTAPPSAEEEGAPITSADEAEPSEAQPLSAEHLNLSTLDLMDALPLAVLLERDGAPIHANSTFFDWTGWDDLDAFQNAGGTHQLLTPDTASGLSHLVTRDGMALTVETRLLEAPFIAPQTQILLMRQKGQSAASPLVSVAHLPLGSGEAIENAAATSQPAPVHRNQTLDMVPWPIVLLNRDCLIRFANSAAANLLDYPAADLADQPFTLALPMDVREDGIRWLDAISDARQQPPQTRTLQVQRRGGQQISTLAVITALDAELSGEAEELLCLVLGPEGFSAEEADKTSAAQPAYEPEQPQDHLREEASLHHLACRLKESLEPAFSILLGQDADSDQLPAGMKPALQQVHQCLIDLKALSAPQDDAPLELCMPILVLEEALAHVAASACRRRITLRTDIEDAPAIRTRPAHLARLMRLLLEEALDASPAHSAVLVSLAFDMELDDAPVRLAIADEGEPLDEVTLAAATAPQSASAQNTTGHEDRFSKAGRPLRYARLQAEAQNIGARLTIRRGLQTGMCTILELPR
ncbi:hypothetical protein ACT6QH_09330 [Xanthobacter sp. TB0139]|uniref:hypothetical protein n=1 Tax=Xanthobacter sp. TB0139 TaxID=3459178 RepID=UPI00403A00A8